MAPEADNPAPANTNEAAVGVAWRSSWQLLGGRQFRLYFLGSVGSNLGTWLQNTVQVLLAYQFTHSVFGVGLVVSAQFAGTLFLSPWAAVVADRCGERRTLVITQCLSAVIAVAMGVAYASHHLNERWLVLGALGLGLAFALALPLQTALVPTLVSPSDTEPAMAMNSVSYNSGRALAPALAVVVIATGGADLIFYLNAVSFTIFALALRTLKTDKRFAADQGPSAGAAPGSRERAKVADGIREARQKRRLLLLLAIVGAVTFADDPIQVLSPGIAHLLHMHADWAAYCIAALGWGIVLGSLPPVVRRKGVHPSHASKRAACSLLALAVSVVIFAMALTPVVSVIAAFTAGVAGLFTGAATQALIVGSDRKTAASVAGLWAIAWAGTKPIASLLDGWLASHTSILLTAIFLAFPAAFLAVCELAIPNSKKDWIKAWSLSKYHKSKALTWHGRALRLFDSALHRFGVCSLPEKT
jgi:MFS family permease